MAEPIYKLWMSKPTEAWYQLSEEERASLQAKEQEAMEKVGGKMVIVCNSIWSSEPYVLFGVNEYPDIEAAQKHAELSWEHQHFRYFEAKTLLGTVWPPS
jgi:hypothetical protein